MILKTFVEGPIDANNYLLIDEESKEAVMIDCSDARKELLEEIKSLGLKLKYILLTHGHFDHIMGVDVFKEQFGVDAYVSQEDIKQIRNEYREKNVEESKAQIIARYKQAISLETTIRMLIPKIWFKN